MRTLRTVSAVVGVALVTIVGAASVVGGASPPDLVAVARVDADRGDSVQIAPTQPPPPAPVADPATEVVERTNALRAQSGLAPLVIHPQLVQAATTHSQDQASNNRMSHIGSNGSTMASRLSATGYSWRMVAENVAAGQGSAASVTDAWANSAGHRANMLNGSLVHVGVAVATSATGTPYWTMVLAAPG